MKPKLIIVTDLDGTLLHPDTYSYKEAAPALRLTEKKGIPVIFCSSKTRAEIVFYRKKLKNICPFVSENGGGVFIPAGYFPFGTGGKTENGYEVFTLGRPYKDIRAALVKIRKMTGVDVRGFGDMSVKEVAVLAGLTLSEAAMARQREFDEPFVFADGGAPIDMFLKAVEDAGFAWTKGRFYHMLGDNDKGRAFRLIKGYYERAYGTVKTIGLGDSLNDLPLLKEADVPVLVQKKGGVYEDRIRLAHIIRADAVGPKGWNNAVIRLIGI